jgi:alkylation response protein AidB-like acyl-CoA dehydrogenase
VEPLKVEAKAQGLWNLFLPSLRDDEPGTRLSNCEYAPLAEIMGRIPWASEVFNCSAPDTGNMELLHLFATPEQRREWLLPLLNGEIRSCIGITEPDVASSDPTNLQTTIRRDGGDYVINGRKWFTTGALHPNARFRHRHGLERSGREGRAPQAPLHGHRAVRHARRRDRAQSADHGSLQSGGALRSCVPQRPRQ